MNFLSLATHRSSIRHFQNRSIDMQALHYVLEATRMAPSATNAQPWHFVVVTEPILLEQIRATYPRNWMTTAPVVIVAIGDHRTGWHRGSDQKDFTEVDVAIAVDHLTLAAAEQGLGSCWVCNFDQKACSRLFELPDHLEPVALIPLGYPVDDTPIPKKRKELDQLVHWNKFQISLLT